MFDVWHVNVSIADVQYVCSDMMLCDALNAYFSPLCANRNTHMRTPTPHTTHTRDLLRK